MPGVVQTAVGYSQGQTKNPSYQDVSALVWFVCAFWWSWVGPLGGCTPGAAGQQPRPVAPGCELQWGAQELGCIHGVAAPATSERSASHTSCLCLAARPPCSQVCSGTTGHAEVVQVVYDPTEVRSAGLRLF